MTYPHTRRPLSPALPLYAVREFVWDGVSYAIGQRFTASIRRDRLSELWTLRYLDHEQIAQAPLQPPVAVQPPQSGVTHAPSPDIPRRVQRRH